MLSTVLFMLASAIPTHLPSQGLLTIEGFDCISSQISPEQAQAYYEFVRRGRESEAFASERELTDACQAKHGWSDIQTRNAFRVSVMDGGVLAERLIERIQELGDFKPFLDQYYEDHVTATERQMLEDIFQSGKLDKDLTAMGYPEHPDMREWAYGYFEWRGALRNIEDDFRNGELRR